MSYKYLIGLLLLIIQLNSCKELKETNENIETVNFLNQELLLLKNGAFCDFYSSITREQKCSIHDASTYIQISELYGKYFMDSSLVKIKDKWKNKEYKAYNKDDSLFLMKSLDFYNSQELKHYIDSIRIIELNQLKLKN